MNTNYNVEMNKEVFEDVSVSAKVERKRFKVKNSKHVKKESKRSNWKEILWHRFIEQ